MTELATFTQPRPYHWTLELYETLASAGAFDDAARVELIEGVILEMAPQQTIHSHLKAKLYRRIDDVVGAFAPPLQVYIEPTLRIPPDSAPEPDIAVSSQLPGRSYLHLEGLALVVEIANTTADHDLGRKAELYGRSGVAEYWVLEVDAACIHRLWSPGPDGYGAQDKVALGEPCASITMPDLTIATTDLI